MPSPVGHLLAGSAIALIAQRAASRPRDVPRQMILCAALAALPDADLLIPATHRTITHSITSIPVIFILATLVTGWVTGRSGWRLGLLCATAWASHIPLDWFGADLNPPSGIQLLWPVSDHWFISGIDLFASTERRGVLTPAAMITNARAAVQELVILGPVVVWLWLWRRRDG